MTDGSFSTPTILVKTICESDMLNNVFCACSNVIIASVQIKAGSSCLFTYFSSITRKKNKTKKVIPEVSVSEIKEMKKWGAGENKGFIYIALSWNTSASCQWIQNADISHSWHRISPAGTFKHTCNLTSGDFEANYQANTAAQGAGWHLPQRRKRERKVAHTNTQHTRRRALLNTPTHQRYIF